LRSDDRETGNTTTGLSRTDDGMGEGAALAPLGEHAPCPVERRGALGHVDDVVRRALAERERRSPEESRTWGKARRDEVPRSAHALLWGGADPDAKDGGGADPARPDPVDLIRSQDEARVEELVPVRHERMATSPFAFFRGGALVMASDLSRTPTTPIRVQACGDAHISNFGLFASPERRLVFDVNDFDETARGPWEWDVKRLVTSVEVCARDRGFSDDRAHDAALACAAAYHRAMDGFSRMGNLDVWYAHADADSIAKLVEEHGSKKDRKATREVLDRARSKDSTRAVEKLTEVVDGQLRIVSDPPLVVPLRDFVRQRLERTSDADGAGRAAAPARVRALSDVAGDIAERLGGTPEERAADLIRLILHGYRKSLPDDRRALFDSYRGVDVARKVVGVGSVGTRAWICVFEGASPSDPLVLQVKEAQESVLERFVGRSPFAEHGRRVVEGQRAIQVASDVMLGWTRLPGDDGRIHDYYVRQLWDGKGSVDLTRVSAGQLTRVGELCAWTLAHAHARTGDRFAIAGYLGASDAFDQAVAAYAHAYADLNERDYDEFVRARREGRLS
jgi:uncharacterized protein (DUF2252 family)